MKRITILTLLVLAVALTGCKVDMGFETVITEDGPQSFATILGVDEEMKSLLETEGDTLEDTFSDIPYEAEITSYNEGDLYYVKATAQVDTLEELEALFTEGDLPLSVTQEGDSFFFEADMSETGGDLGVNESDIPVGDGTSLTITVKVTLPGEIIESNADVVEGSTLTWSRSMFDPELRFYAESDASASSGVGFIPIVIGVVVLFGIAIVLVAAIAVIKQKNKDKDSNSEPDSSGTAAAPHTPEAGPETLEAPSGTNDASTDEEPANGSTDAVKDEDVS